MMTKKKPAPKKRKTGRLPPHLPKPMTLLQ